MQYSKAPFELVSRTNGFGAGGFVIMRTFINRGSDYNSKMVHGSNFTVSHMSAASKNHNMNSLDGNHDCGPPFRVIECICSLGV